MTLMSRNNSYAYFSMSSITDIIFLLLLCFMIASTMTSPNDMKVNLPQSRSSAATKARIVKVGIDAEGQYSLSEQGQKPMEVIFDEVEPYLQNAAMTDSTTVVALYADENVPYREIVKVLDIANENRLKLVIATKTLEK